MSNISIIGSGYVGSSIGKLLLGAKHNVIFHDINETVVSSLREEGYKATTDLKQAFDESGISFLCVPTPTKEGKIDLSYVKAATEAIGTQLRTKSSYHLIVIKSTVVPTTTEQVIKSLLENASGKTCGKDFGLCTNPEFLTQVNKTTTDPELKSWYESNPDSIKAFEDKIVIGEYDKMSGDLLEEVFSGFNIPIFRTDLRTAEMIKYVHNLNLATRISFWNEIFLICNNLGIDSKKTAEIVSTDKRIGKYGTIHGKAFGGTCLPKDLQAFVSFIDEQDMKIKLLNAVLEINKHMAEKYGIRE